MAKSEETEPEAMENIDHTSDTSVLPECNDPLPIFPTHPLVVQQPNILSINT
jgi:hypothetical protein